MRLKLWPRPARATSSAYFARSSVLAPVRKRTAHNHALNTTRTHRTRRSELVRFALPPARIGSGTQMPRHPTDQQAPRLLCKMRTPHTSCDRLQLRFTQHHERQGTRAQSQPLHLATARVIEHASCCVLRETIHAMPRVPSYSSRVMSRLASGDVVSGHACNASCPRNQS